MIAQFTPEEPSQFLQKVLASAKARPKWRRSREGPLLLADAIA
jgi:hypothetical protein